MLLDENAKGTYATTKKGNKGLPWVLLAGQASRRSRLGPPEQRLGRQVSEFRARP